MNPKHLEALVIDHHFGELTPEVSGLLEAYLSTHPAAAAEAADILAILSLTRQTLEVHPELAKMKESDRLISSPHLLQTRTRKWPLMAATAALALLAATGGYFAGNRSTGTSGAVTAVTEVQNAVPTARPWTRYRMVIDPRGHGMQVVRVDDSKRSEEAYQ